MSTGIANGPNKANHIQLSLKVVKPQTPWRPGEKQPQTTSGMAMAMTTDALPGAPSLHAAQMLSTEPAKKPSHNATNPAIKAPSSRFSGNSKFPLSVISHEKKKNEAITIPSAPHRSTLAFLLLSCRILLATATSDSVTLAMASPLIDTAL